VAKIVRGAAGRSPQESDLAAATKRSILVRILHNLMGLSQRAQDAEGLLKYVDAIVAVAPDSGEERWMRAVLRARLGQRDGAMSDVTWLLETRRRAPERRGRAAARAGTGMTGSSDIDTTPVYSGKKPFATRRSFRRQQSH
jgi:hypothetical protein